MPFVTPNRKNIHWLSQIILPVGDGNSGNEQWVQEKVRCTAVFFLRIQWAAPVFLWPVFFRAMCDFILSNSEKQNQDNIWVFFKDMH